MNLIKPACWLSEPQTGRACANLAKAIRRAIGAELAPDLAAPATQAILRQSVQNDDKELLCCCMLRGCWTATYYDLVTQIDAIMRVAHEHIAEWSLNPAIFDGERCFVIPKWINLAPSKADNYFGDWFFDTPQPEQSPQEEKSADMWLTTMWDAEQTYRRARDLGWSEPETRVLLPQSVAGKLSICADVAGWRRILKACAERHTSSEVFNAVVPLLRELQTKFPVVFDDIAV